MPASTHAAPGIERPFDAGLVAARMRATSTGPQPILLDNGDLVMAAAAVWPRLTGSPFATRKSALRSTGALPGEIDLRTAQLDGPVKNQQMVGVCWSFAVSSIMDNALRRQGNADVVAPLHLISSNAWDTLHRKGNTDALVTESSWPYDPPKACKLAEHPRDPWCGDAYHVTPGSWRDDPYLVAEVRNANASGLHRVTKFETIDPPTFEAIADELAAGREVYAAFRIDHKAWGRAKNGTIDDYASEERGPHATTLVGYRTNGPRGRELLVKNSWGTSWGTGGYAWISERSLREHGDDFFTVEVDDGGSVKPLPLPLPNPQPQPQKVPSPLPFPIPWLRLPQASQSCASGQVSDVVLGTCANSCPRGNAPVAGVCASWP